MNDLNQSANKCFVIHPESDTANEEPGGPPKVHWGFKFFAEYIINGGSISPAAFPHIRLVVKLFPLPPDCS
ncbi:unnamed protein product, partial [Rotaria magnacalcarata]